MDFGGLMMVMILAAVIPICAGFARGNWHGLFINWLIGVVAVIVCANIAFMLFGADAAQASQALNDWTALNHDMGQPSSPGLLAWYIRANLPLGLTLIGLATCQALHIAHLNQRYAR